MHTPITLVRTALHMATVKSVASAAMIHALVSRGHSSNTKNRYGWTALDFAKQVGKRLLLNEAVQLRADNCADNTHYGTMLVHQPACSILAPDCK